jgi:pyruvate kinase
MLSAETAAGRHPVLAVEMMDRIVRAAEGADVMPLFKDSDHDVLPRIPAAAVTHAARVLAEGLAASAIVGISRTGQTAELLSRFRGRVPIYAFTSDQDVARRLALWWGITPVLCQIQDELEANIAAMERYLMENRRATPAETIVITGSHPFGVGVHTNFVRFHVLGQ